MRFVFLLLGAILVLGACSAPNADIAPLSLTETSADMLTDTEQAPFRIIGYVTHAVVAETIPYEEITHINYSFLIPNADGTFEMLPNGWKLKKIVETAHQNDVQVLISVGGWGWDAEFEEMAANPTTRAVFVAELEKFVDEYQLDGADIDWEYPDVGASAANFLKLIEELGGYA